MPNPDSSMLWKSLKGIICVYKPAEISVRSLKKAFVTKVCKDLNELDVNLRYPAHCEVPGSLPLLQSNSLCVSNTSSANSLVHQTPVDSSLSTSVTQSLNLKYHPSVIGPRYLDEDLRVSWSNYLGWNTSGVLIFGLRKGAQIAHYIRENRSTRAYRISGVFGKATDNGLKSGKVVERSTWKYIRQHHIERILSAMQASHQSKMFEICGVDMQSQLAYDLAVKGPIRPANSKLPIIYGLKCIEYTGPEFTIEVQGINENEEYLLNLVHEIGLKLHSTAHTTGIKCIRHSCFTLEHALLQKHWTLEHITQNMDMCNSLLMENENIVNQDSAALRVAS